MKQSAWTQLDDSRALRNAIDFDVEPNRWAAMK